jgi:nicotinate-nucleotide adenylyltransferase
MNWALYGGMFDPPHLGHRRVAEAARQQLGANVLISPAGLPPHRPAPGAPESVRRAMIKATFADFEIDWTEMQAREVTATVDVLRRLHKQRPGEWILLIGADQQLDRWREHEQLRSLARVCFAPRAGYQAAMRDGDIMLDIEPQSISSTLVRERLRAGQSVDGLLDPITASLARSVY